MTGFFTAAWCSGSPPSDVDLGGVLIIFSRPLNNCHCSDAVYWNGNVSVEHRPAMGVNHGERAPRICGEDANENFSFLGFLSCFRKMPPRIHQNMPFHVKISFFFLRIGLVPPQFIPRAILQKFGMLHIRGA